MAKANVMVGAAIGAVFSIAHPSRAQNVAEPAYTGLQPTLVQGSTSVFATATPVVRHVYAAAPDVLALVIDAQHVWSGPLEPYRKQDGDRVRYSRPQNYGTQGHQFFWGRDVYRDGKNIGQLVGLKEDFLAPAYVQRGEPLDTTWADAPASYAIDSPDDKNFAAPVTPDAVYRKTRPQMYEWVDDGVQKGSNRHELYLRLPHPLKPGCTYAVHWRGKSPLAQGVGVRFDDTRLRTEAVQVNQAGYHPRQSVKAATLSMWLGSGGGVDFSALRAFQVVDDASGSTVFEGLITLRKAAVPGVEMPPEKTAEPTDDLPTSVYQLDFSAFRTPGVYRIVVPGLGTSFPFRIDQNVWRDATLVSAEGMFNQRSGIAHGPPYSQFTRPRDLHPADGVPIYKTDPAKYYDPKIKLAATRPSAFERIQASILEDQTEPNAWGGWHDAADYDRDILPQDHLQPVQAMLDLYDANPAYFETLKLNIPESANAVPDIIDEALWCTDLWLRLQHPDGGVPSAVESIEHPSEPSWLLGQPTAVTPPTPATCQMWAAAAAHMSLALQKYDPARAEAYRDSALRAMAWADANAAVPNVFGHADPATAAVWLYRLTGDQAWHAAFKRATSDSQDNPKAGRAYALLPDHLADPAFLKKARADILKAADAKVDRTDRWTWHLGPQRFAWGERLGTSYELIAAHRLTGDPKYVDAMVQQAQFAMGLNPTNASYTNGLGTRRVVPFNLEARYLGEPYPRGITSYGPGPRNIWRGTAIEKTLTAAGLYPAWKDWPWAESSFDLKSANLNEYTVTDMGSILSTRAYLAQYFATVR